MKKSSIAIIVLILNIGVLGLMLVALGFLAIEGYEETICYGSAGILGATQLFGSFLLLFSMKNMTSVTRKNLGLYWVLALTDVFFTCCMSNRVVDNYMEIGIGIGLLLSLYHLYINISALNIVDEPR